MGLLDPVVNDIKDAIKAEVANSLPAIQQIVEAEITKALALVETNLQNQVNVAVSQIVSAISAQLGK